MGEGLAEAPGGEVEEEVGGFVAAGGLEGGLANGTGGEDAALLPLLEGDEDGEDGGVEVAAVGGGGGGIAEGEGGEEGGEAGGEEAGVREGEGGERVEEVVEDVDECLGVGVGEEGGGERVVGGGREVEQEEVAVEQVPWGEQGRQLSSTQREELESVW